MPGATTVLLLTLAATAAVAGPTALSRSEVVFMGAKTPDVYQAYGATMVSWGGQAAKDDPASIAQFVERNVQPAHALGMRYCTGLAFRTAFARMIDFDPNFMDAVTRDLDGQPILVPWLWDHKHKGHGAYWFCTHAPGYQKYLRDQARRAMVGNPEGLHIDDYAGTSGCPGGCFCPSCLADFTIWLKQHASAEELRQAGVTSLDGFDYAKFLKAKGITAEVVRQTRWRVPLDAQYQSFQILTNREFVRDIKAYAEQLRGAPVLLSVNSSAFGAQSLVIAPVIDYFCGEVGQQADKDRPTSHPIFAYKIGEALHKPTACTADGWDWAYVNEKHRPGLVRTWIAQAYACGQSLMAPHRQWAYTKEKGTHWYQSQPSDYAPLYQFVRHHRELFDGYDDAWTVSLLYSNAARRTYRGSVQAACTWLAEHNYPFRVLPAGDEWLDTRLTAADLAAGQALVAPQPLVLDPAQQALVDAAQNRVAVWPEKADNQAGVTAFEQQLARLCPPPITITGATDVVAMPRAKSATDPLVVHLLNRHYQPATDDVQPIGPLTVTLSPAVTAGRTFTSATLVQPGREDLALKLQDGTVTVPELGLWGLVVLR